jgi:hypothetical protein
MKGLLMKVAVILLALYAVLCGAPCASAQQGGACGLSAGQSPRLRGLRLGMTAAQLRELYPRLPALKADEFGQAKGDFSGLNEVDEAAFEGVESIQLNFVDDRLVEFGVYYKAVPFDNLDQFIAKLRESLKLHEAWAGEGYNTTRTLACDGFRIEAGATSYWSHGMTPYVSLRQPGAEAVVAKRAEEKRERQRQAFKP